MFFLFTVSVIIRISVFEFMTFDINLKQWSEYFGFFCFVYSVGCLILYLFSHSNISKIMKLSAIGVSFVIQFTIWIDYFFFPWEIPYNDIEWIHFLKALSSFLLDPDLSYATGVGHILLLIFLISMSFMYIFIKRSLRLQNNLKKTIHLTLIRALIGSFNFYILTIYAGTIFSFFEVFVNNFYLSTIPGYYGLVYSLVYLFHFSPLYLLILFKILYDEKIKHKNLLNSIFKKFNTIPKLISSPKKFNILPIIDKKFRPKYLIKFIIYLVFVFIGIIFLLITVWFFPYFSFS
ncbi:MAG: hypothetical protein ACTSPY_13520 [Candidatus Helarchaeota archaeon]